MDRFPGVSRRAKAIVRETLDPQPKPLRIVSKEDLLLVKRNDEAVLPRTYKSFT